MFSISRMLPGQLYSNRAVLASGEKHFCTPNFSLYCCRKL